MRHPFSRRRRADVGADASASQGPTDELGLLQPIVDAERAAGREVHLTSVAAVARGESPSGRLAAPRGRAQVESTWDLGPLIGWVPAADGWQLVDDRSGATLDLGRVPDDRPQPPTAGRARLGYPDQVTGMAAWLTTAPDVEDELRRLAAPVASPDAGVLREAAASAPSLVKRRIRTGPVASVVLHRVAEVLAVASSGTGSDDDLLVSLPDWLRAACAPAWGTAAFDEACLELAALDPVAARRAGRRLRWSADELVRQLRPEYRPWRFRAARSVDDHVVDVFADAAVPTHLAAATWLLAAAGAETCEPVLAE